MIQNSDTSTAIPVVAVAPTSLKTYRYIRKPGPEETFSDEYLNQVLSTNPDLQQIFLVGCSNISSLSLAELAKRDMHVIDLSGCNQFSTDSEKFVDFLRGISSSIRNLYLRRCDFLTNRMVEVLLQNSYTIQTLDISFCTNVDFAMFLEFLVEHCSSTRKDSQNALTIMFLLKEDYEENSVLVEPLPDILSKLKFLKEKKIIVVMNHFVETTSASDATGAGAGCAQYIESSAF